MKIPCVLGERLNLMHDRLHDYPSVGAAFFAINKIYQAWAWGRDNPHPMGMDPKETEPYIHLNTVKFLISSIARGELTTEEVLAELNSTGE